MFNVLGSGNNSMSPRCPMPESLWGVAAFMLSHGGPRLYVALLVVCITLRFYLGWAPIDFLLIIGLVSVRGIMEWVLHAYFWHARRLPLLGRIVSPLTALHARHHKDPTDVEALLFGSSSVLVVFVMTILFITIFSSSFSLALTISLASLLILMLHEFCHVVAHSKIEPISPILRRAVLCHRAHHYINSRVCMGVSSILGDKIFGTYRQYER